MCLNTSLDVITYNTKTLFDKLTSLEQQSIELNSLYSQFAANSATWLPVLENLSGASANWDSMYSTVHSTSANWQQEFSLYYVKNIPITEWWPDGYTLHLDYIKDWLTTHFNPGNFIEGQKVSVFVSFYQDESFSYKFERSYNETCHPQGTGGTLDCAPCDTSSFSRGCNHHGGKAREGPCDNAFSYCGKDTPSAGISARCQGHNGRMLKVSYTCSDTDTSTARIKRIKFKNTNNQWIYQT